MYKIHRFTEEGRDDRTCDRLSVFFFYKPLVKHSVVHASRSVRI